MSRRDSTTPAFAAYLRWVESPDGKAARSASPNYRASWQAKGALARAFMAGRRSRSRRR